MSNQEQVETWLEEAGATLIKPSGDNMISTCPFHQDTNRSFSMNAETGQFICFAASCGVSGGVYKFLVEALGYDSKRAIEVSSEWVSSFDGQGDLGWKIDIPEWDARRLVEDKTQEEVEERLLGVYDFCPKYMVRERKLSRETLRRWEIGFDTEARRVTFAVRDASGRLIGFSKRSVEKKGEYLHLGFKRSQVLYGEFWIPKRADEVWVAEGQIDALALSDFDVEYPTSTMSARVGPQQIAHLARYPRVVLAYDNDADGHRAALQTGDKLVETCNAEVLVAMDFGDFKDAGDLRRHGNRSQVRKYLRSARPYDLARLDWI